jgi:pimeloyl-ACP methyl ester carboxylesterase
MEDFRSIWTHVNQHSFNLGYVDAQGIRTRYMQAGPKDAEAIIMLHGTAGSLENFSANIGPLSEHFNCYAIDMVGCGYTDKPDVDYGINVYVDHIRRFMDAMGIEKATFMGVSMGSWISTRFALTYPDRVTGLCMLAPAGLNDHAEAKAQITKVRGSAASTPTWDSIRTVFKRLLLDEKNMLPDMMAVRLAIYLQPGYPEAMKHVLSVLTPEAWSTNRIKPEEYAQVKAPALVICSVDDPHTVYVKSARDIADALPHVRMVEMPKVAHWPQFEDPENFNRIFVQFMNERASIS